jgi:predicted ATP-dependent endonuclease of OLD family
MKIEIIEIKNFRSLHNIIVYPQDILALVGRNNSGKSNLIKALHLFFEASTRLVDSECFFNHTKEPIEIFITFRQLSDWEKEQFESWMLGERLIVGKRFICKDSDSYEIHNLAVVQIPDIEWLQEDTVSGEKITEWWSDKEQLKVGQLDFAVELGTAKPTVAAWKETARKFLEAHGKDIPWKKLTKENPKGYPNVLKGALPEFIYIPAVRDILDEARVTQASPFGKLINSVVEKISDEQKEMLSKKLQEIESFLNRAGDSDRIFEIKEIERKLNTLMSELMECDVEIEMPMPKLNEVFSTAKIYANDGIRTAIDTKGHGLQRSMIFTILRAYAELSHIEKAKQKAGERTTIIAIEEPELYLHPQSQRTFMTVFRKIASGRDQIIYSTHSSLLVDIGHFDEICIMRREKKNSSHESFPTQLAMAVLLKDLKTRKGIDGTEQGMREKYSNAFNPMINEGFFADKVVIVEGPSEQYILPIYAECMGYDLDRNNISVVHADGKGQMDRLLRVFNGFKIPTYLWFDGDKTSDDKDVVGKTLELLQLCGECIKSKDEIATEVEDHYAVLEDNLEKTLEKEVKEYTDLIHEAVSTLGPIGKPLKHRFAASKLREKTKDKNPEDILPETIIKITAKIKGLTYKSSILCE